MPPNVNDENAILARKDLIASMSFVADRLNVSPKRLHECDFYRFVNIECPKCGDDRRAIARLIFCELMIGSDDEWDAICSTIAMGVMHYMGQSGATLPSNAHSELAKLRDQTDKPTKEQLGAWFDNTYK